MARIEITAESKATTYWVAVDDQDVEMRNGFGSVVVPAGDHYLYWGMYGSVGDTVVVTLERDDVPLGRFLSEITQGNRGGGFQPFGV